MKRTTKMVGAAVATALVALSCAGLGFAASASQTEAGGATNVSAFHEGLGFKFAEMVQPIDDQMTPLEKSANTVGTREFCLQCHDWDAIVDSTVLTGDVTVYNKTGMYNVHDNHNGLVNCSDCHTIEGESVLGCINCHYMDVPAGWHGFH